MRRPGPVLTIVLLVPLVLAACGDGSGGSASTTATGRFGALHTEVCRAADQARRGATASARRTFDDVHVGLHDLAAAAEQEDRAVAARLLEAKQRVEADLSPGTLGELVPTVAAAVEVTGGTAPDNCP